MSVKTTSDQPIHATSRLRPALATLAAVGIIVASCALGAPAWADDAPAIDPGTSVEIVPVAADPAPENPAPADPAPASEPTPEVVAPPTEPVAPVADPAPAIAPWIMISPILLPPALAALTFVSGPMVSGDVTEGGTLTASATFSGPTTSVTYQWYVGSPDDSAILDGEEASTLELTSDLVGQTIWVEITATNGGAPVTAQSAATNPVAEFEFDSSTDPTISGTATVGSTLTAIAGEFSAEPDSLRYEWFQEWNGVRYAIDGANDSIFKLTSEQLGATVLVKVVAVLADYDDVWTWSAPTAIVHGSITSVVPPTLSGNLTVGSVLTATPGTWSSSAATVRYDWGVSGGEFGDSLPDTGATHTITTADMGLTVVVNVSVTNGDEVSDPIRLSTATTIPFAVPNAPFATDAGITAANQGAVTGTTSKNSATVTVPAGNPGDHVYVYGFSTPTGLGWYVLDANKQLVIDFSSLPVGSHHLVVLNQAGAVIGWLAVARSGAAVAQIASTGVKYDVAGVSGIAGLVLLSGVALLVGARLKRRKQAFVLA